ncbi:MULTISPECIES: TetR/AcrR family transcriptional regulator [Antrihabitans]|jgi:AcrR family transcriptional regulator|uniref:TetR family transcriptional regulator n=2 Tax=Antrihabitans TaxID=2799491 RepID=A0A934NND5_9NOCA|nr:TetR family transcriptional regulator [Antrihabitans stalagmiti]MBJ8338408.1 TetR family transcriptional regulator [Antrihabitans stalagmiti]
MSNSVSRVPYQEAARSLLRDSVLDSMRELLGERDWNKITLSDISKRAGVSRQTLYNEFNSRLGLTQAYALRLADQFVDHVEGAIRSNEGNVRAAIAEGLQGFFMDSASEPLILSLLSGDVKPDLLRLITLDAGPLIVHARTRLADTFQNSWIDTSRANGERLATALVRLALSYIGIPPESFVDVAADLAALFGPYVDEVSAAG